MTRYVAALVLSLTGLTASAAPAAAVTCETNTFRTTQVRGWYSLAVVRRVTVCRNDAGQAVSVNVTVRRFPVAR